MPPVWPADGVYDYQSASYEVDVDFLKIDEIRGPS